MVQHRHRLLRRHALIFNTGKSQDTSYTNVFRTIGDVIGNKLAFSWLHPYLAFLIQVSNRVLVYQDLAS